MDRAKLEPTGGVYGNREYTEEFKAEAVKQPAGVKVGPLAGRHAGIVVPLLYHPDIDV